jgi:hypothetical protein
VFFFSFLLSVMSFAPAKGQTVNSTVNVIDPNPSSDGGDNLEKVIDYFTSTTIPSVVLGQGTSPGGPGGLYLYSTTDPINGPWTKTTIAPAGNFYERAKAFKYPGDTYPGVVASVNQQLIWYANPHNQGNNVWGYTITINPNAGCHDLHIADIDGDGKQDMVCSATSLQGTESFIAFQNNYNSWTIVNNLTPAGDGIDVISIAGVPGTHIVACVGTSLYWYQNPLSTGGNPRQTTQWPANYIGDCNAGVSIATGSFNGSDGVIVASNETNSGGAWTSGLAWLEPTSNPFAPWTKHVIDTTYRDVHQITTGTLNGVFYFTVGEQEQASSLCNSQGYNDHPLVQGCRVAVFTFNNSIKTFNPPNVLSLQGTQNQATVPYQSGFLMVGANHNVFGAALPAFQTWFVTPVSSTGSGTGTGNSGR